MSLASSRRRALHARVLAAGRDLGLPPGRIVHHASGAGAGDVVVEVGPVAAAEASRLGSHREAAAHYRRVLVHADLLEAGELAEIEECYSLECWAVNDAAEAEASARRALAHRREQGGPLEAIGRNLRRIGRTRWFVGDATAAEEMLAEAIDVMEGGGETVREELASTLAYRGLIAGIRHSMAAARPWIVRALEVAAEGDQRIRALVLNDVGTVRYLHEGDPGELAESIRLASAEGLHIDVVRGHVNLASCALAHRRYDEVKRHVADAARYSEEHQVYAFDGLASAVIAQVLFETGEWEAAEQAASGVSRDESFARIPASTVLARLKVRRGDPDASDAIDAAVAAAEATGEAQRIAPAAGAAAELAWMQRRLHTFVPTLRRAHQIALTSGVPRWIGETAIWLRAAGELDEIPAAVEDAPRYMMEGRWEEAAAAWDGIGAPYEAAVARSFAEDTEVALSGLAELDSLGATPMARVTRARLAKRGVEKIPRGPRPSTAANAAGLTARQMDVMRLVVEGFTNAEIADRLFLSARTVDHHVAAILLKLGVESRRQVGARAETLGLVD
jgi:DNA-binding CsgD family transcriptional regulator